MKNKASKVVVTCSSISLLILGLGLLGYRVFRRRENIEEESIKITKEDEIPNPETHSIPSKIEPIDNIAEKKNRRKEYYDIPRESFRDAEELVLQISYRLLETTNFTSANEFLEKLIFGCGKNIRSFDWYSEIPKNIEEAENALRKFELYSRYLEILENKYKKEKE